MVASGGVELAAAELPMTPKIPITTYSDDLLDRIRASVDPHLGARQQQATLRERRNVSHRDVGQVDSSRLLPLDLQNNRAVTRVVGPSDNKENRALVIDEAIYNLARRQLDISRQRHGA
ncbi:MAG: hypothetical protein OXG81_04235 [Acidobacteria bacterium]|nr:hypothetical protein [Acidobacteriota bacterium]